MSHKYAFVTLLTSDHYLPGALALAAALKDVHSSSLAPPDLDSYNFDIVCLVTPETVDVKSIKLLRRAFNHVVGVEVIEQHSLEGLRLLGRLDLSLVLTKLHVFRLSHYDKILFLDADVLPIKPLSHLFLLPHEFAAVPDVGWPDIFNSGLMLLEPSDSKFEEIMSLVRSKGSWDGGDQGILNEWRGHDWHRLSFTYNTTPTAAYTYAPAYSRFGDTIKAIHFIGPNKPWASLPYRAPFSASSVRNIPSTPQSFAYGDLVDRWYAIYDEYYRSQSPPSETEYEVRKYESQWNAPQVPQNVVPPFDLEVLRRVTVEGFAAAPQILKAAQNPPPTPLARQETVHATRTIESRPQEGQYRSLPLEGRVDLMRPPPPPSLSLPTKPEDVDDEVVTPRATPQPPPPVSPIQSLPPTLSPSAVDPNPSHLLSAAPASKSQPLPVIAEQSHENYMSPVSRPSNPLSFQCPRHESPPRPPSPPMLTWNPAVEPPPTNPPPQSAFKPTEYFENAWDMAPVKHVLTDNEDPRGFFVAPPQAKVPDQLIREGHYTQVMHSTAIRPTHQPQPLQPATSSPPPPKQEQLDPHRPDKAKVNVVFPWEDKPRYMPGRVFPRAASPPPASTTKYIAKQKAVEPLVNPLPSEPRAPVQVANIPPSGIPSSSSFRNAWDIDPNIQRYAARLQRPPLASQGTTQPQYMSLKGRRSRRSSSSTFKSWEELGDSSSHEADVEDEVDDTSDVENGDGLTKPGRSDVAARRVSRSSLFWDERTGKTYRSQSVQTVQPKRRDIAVQHSSAETSSTQPTTTTNSSKELRPRVSPAIRRAPPPPPMSMSNLVGRLQGDRGDAGGTPSVDEPQGLLQSAMGRRAQLAVPLRAQKPASSQMKTSPTQTFMPQTTGPVKQDAAPPLRPRSSDDTISSSQGSQEPVSPRDGQLVLSPMTALAGVLTVPPTRKPPGRAWDPARGVDVFKLQSEEVLARFLKMGSWEGSSAA